MNEIGSIAVDDLSEFSRQKLASMIGNDALDGKHRVKILTENSMNEILFRGKTEDGKWVYGLPDYGDFQGTINVIKEFKDGCIKLYKVIPETIAPFISADRS